MTVDDSILGTTNVNGGGNLIVNVNDTSLDLSNISSSIGTVTINDDTNGNNITGSDGNDTLNLSSGNDTVNLGAGDDTINISSMNNLTSSDAITDSSGTDTLNINGNGTIASTDFNVGGFENLNLSSGVDEVTFSDKSSFDTFTNKFTNIDTGDADDEFSFSSQVTEDLDFSNVSSLEKLSFSNADDTVTFGSDELGAGIGTLDLGNGENTVNLNADTSSSVSVTGGTGTDEFVVDFSRVSEQDYTVNGAGGTDTINLSGYSGQTATNALNNVFGNMEELNLSDSGTFTIDAELINSWNSSSEFTISGTGNDTLNITNDVGYNWTTTDSDYSSDNTGADIGGVADTYFIDTDGNSTTDITLHVVA
jgi:hypothetical protein